MSFFIPEAFAATTNGTPAKGMAGGGTLTLLIYVVVIGALFYFLLIRPQSRRAKEHRNLVSNLAKGDEVVTSGGIIGRINKISDDFVEINIAEGINIKVQKNAIAGTLPKGTMKSV